MVHSQSRADALRCLLAQAGHSLRAEEKQMTAPKTGRSLFFLFCPYIRDRYNSRCHDANRTKNSNRKTLDKMKIILKYIENHYMDKITIAEIASEVQFSESHFMRYFKETMGTTFTDYLKDYRLTMAARLLTTSDSTVLAIAEETGFENLSYFNRSFKKKYALTPRQFRAMEGFAPGN